jgi:hypothetical protein
MDTRQFLEDYQLAQTVVGRKLHELVYPPDMHGKMSCEPPSRTLAVAPEIPRGLD